LPPAEIVLLVLFVFIIPLLLYCGLKRILNPLPLWLFPLFAIVVIDLIYTGILSGNNLYNNELLLFALILLLSTFAVVGPYPVFEKKIQIKNSWIVLSSAAFIGSALFIMTTLGEIYVGRPWPAFSSSLPLTGWIFDGPDKSPACTRCRVRILFTGVQDALGVRVLPGDPGYRDRVLRSAGPTFPGGYQSGPAVTMGQSQKNHVLLMREKQGTEMKMTKNKIIHVAFTCIFVIGIYVISILLGNFIAGQDSRTCQVVVFLSILLGMCLCYLTDRLAKKYPGI